jgi:hypothetical protein
VNYAIRFSGAVISLTVEDGSEAGEIDEADEGYRAVTVRTELGVCEAVIMPLRLHKNKRAYPPTSM